MPIFRCGGVWKLWLGAMGTGTVVVGWCPELLDGTEESELDASFAKFLRT
jgi:hypothetical protein